MSAQPIHCPHCQALVAAGLPSFPKCRACGADLSPSLWYVAGSVPGLFDAETVPASPPDCPAALATTPVVGVRSGENVEATRCTTASSGASDLPTIHSYEILEELGRGGMGVVYKARDTRLRHLVAIKMPLVPAGADSSYRTRFLREARAAAGLRHPNICPIYLVDEYEGRPFLVMPFIEGQNLRAWTRASRPNARACAELVARLARAVDYAHQHGVIHRDIKPHNAMIEAETGQPILMDFGLAKQLGEQEGQITHSGQILGTPAYMAPEQARGRTHEVGPLADVYSLGALLYDVLCGQPPFAGSVGEILHKVQSEEPLPPRKVVPSVHRDLETVCLKAMAKEPAARYSSAGELAADLERFAAGEAIQARREGVLARARRWVRRNRVAVTAMILLVTGLAVASFVVLRALQQKSAKGLRNDLIARLDGGDWTLQRFEELEGPLARLDEQSPELAREVRDRLAQALFDWAATPLEEKKGRLLPEHHDRVRLALDLLKPRSPALGADLERRYKDRLGQMESAIDLEPPFADLAAVFDARAPVQRQGNELTIGRSPVLSRVSSTAGMHLTATFAPSWQSASELGLLLNARHERDQLRGYVFQMQAPLGMLSGEKTPRQLTFAQARAANETVVVQVLRNGRPLRKQSVPARDLPSGALRLEVGRNRDRLSLQIHGSAIALLECRDLFPLSGAGVCGLVCPAEVRLVSLKADRRTMPAAPSPLEKGDDLYLSDRAAEALSFYREQARISPGAAVGQEARLKAGITLMTLGRLDEAAAALEPLIAEAVDPWRDMAALHRWLICLRQNRPGDGEIILDKLLLRSPQGLAQVLTYFPDVYSAELLQFYRNSSYGLNFYRHDPDRVKKMERVVQVERLFNEPWVMRHTTYRTRIRAYRVSNSPERALEVAQDTLRGLPREYHASDLVAETCWLLREKGALVQAKATLNGTFAAHGHLHRTDLLPLFLERARLLAAEGHRAEAEKALEDFIREVSSLAPRQVFLPDAWIMLGFLRDERGDRKRAEQAWGEAYRLERDGLEQANPKEIRGSRVVNFLMAGSLCGELADAEVEALLKRVLQMFGNEATAQLIRSANLLRPALLRECWRTERGRAQARRLAFQEMSYPEYLRLPPMLVGLEMARGVFGGSMTAEQEELVWKAAEEGVGGVMSGAIEEGQVFGLAATWKGVTGFLGWGGIRGSLAPSLRGPIAYVMGHRFLRRNSPKEARQFFAEAKADAPAGSPLLRLAQAELDRRPPQ